MKRIYIAGGSTERITIVQPWIERVRASGMWEVTHDWTQEVNYHRPAAECATQDVSGVLSADAVWLLVPEAVSEGMAFEFGLALQSAHAVVASGPSTGRCIFHTQARRRFERHEDAFLWLTGKRVDAPSDYLCNRAQLSTAA